MIIKLLVLVEKFGMFLLLALLFITFCFAVQDAMNVTGSSPSLLQAVVNTVNSDGDSAQGWAKAMHFILRGVLAWAAVRVYVATAGLNWDTLKARYFMRSHIVIAAGRRADDKISSNILLKSEGSDAYVDKSELAVELALSLAKDNDVVLSLPGLDEGRRAKLWAVGVKVLAEAMDMPELLAATGANRARTLIAMRDHYADNITLTATSLSPAFGNKLLECKCMLDPLNVKRTFKVEDYFESSALPRIRVFNDAELLARRLLKTFPPDAAVATSEVGVHVLLVGLGAVGQSILLQLARVGHYRSVVKSKVKPKVTVVDRNVKARLSQALAAYPALGDLLEVIPVEARIEDLGPNDLKRWMSDDPPLSIVYVCTKNEIANLRIARLCLRLLHPPGAHKTEVKVIALDAPGGCILSDFAEHGEFSGKFHLFSLLANNGGNKEQSLLTDVDDQRAKILHRNYCAENEKEASNLPWEQLPEDLRDSNRFTTDHFDVKLRAIGCGTLADEGIEAAVLSEAEHELLAELEHNRWCADKLLAGWRYGSEKVPIKMLHPNLVHYALLPEDDKKKDRQQVDTMMAIIKAEGLTVTRMPK
jgi:hypothetical protein